MSEVPTQTPRATHPCRPSAQVMRGNSGSEEGSYLRRIDFCITQLKAQGPSRTCNESKEEEEEDTKGNASLQAFGPGIPLLLNFYFCFETFHSRLLRRSTLDFFTFALRRSTLDFCLGGQRSCGETFSSSRIGQPTLLHKRFTVTGVPRS